MNPVGAEDEEDDGELDAGAPGSIPLAETTSTAGRSERDQPRLEASSTAGESTGTMDGYSGRNQ